MDSQEQQGVVLVWQRLTLMRAVLQPTPHPRLTDKMSQSCLEDSNGEIPKSRQLVIILIFRRTRGVLIMSQTAQVFLVHVVVIFRCVRFLPLAGLSIYSEGAGQNTRQTRQIVPVKASMRVQNVDGELTCAPSRYSEYLPAAHRANSLTPAATPQCRPGAIMELDRVNTGLGEWSRYAVQVRT